MDTKTHWEEIYKTKTSDAVSWYRPHLETSLALIERAAEGYSASIIDVGGGESTLVDDLLARGYANLTVLDVSQTAVPTVFREKAGASITVITTCSKLVLLLLVMLAVPTVWAQGPPFQTDDPTPVDLGHYEAYIFGGVDGTPVEIDPVGPAFEFNWGALPNVQLHAILPLGAILPSNDPIYAPGGIGPSAFGLMDMELGVKYGFLKQTKPPAGRPFLRNRESFKGKGRKKALDFFRDCPWDEWWMEFITSRRKDGRLTYVSAYQFAKAKAKTVLHSEKTPDIAYCS
jgi:hypothetical protein